jgi:peptidoglycan/xylan/chitin deacetylase (PgdA/CDA1 family)
VSRRSFLAGAAALGLAACSSGGSDPTTASAPASATAGGSDAAAATTSTVPTGPARFASTGPVGKSQVALTFHTNGSAELFHQMVDLLARRRVVVTTFVVGQWLDANVDLGKVLVDAGHELENHTYTHPTFLALPEAAMTEEIARCRAAVAQVAGGGGRMFRISGTDDGTTTPPSSVLGLAGSGGYGTVLGFDVDPKDFADPGADLVAQRTIAGLRDGAVVSLHFGHAGTVAAMPRILDAVAAKGLTPVTASTLLGL